MWVSSEDPQAQIGGPTSVLNRRIGECICDLCVNCQCRSRGSQSLRTRLSTSTKVFARGRSCSANLFLFQCERVNIVRSHVTNQHRSVLRIEAHPKGDCPCVTESLQIHNPLRAASETRTRNTPGSSPRAQEIDELAIRRPRGKIALAPLVALPTISASQGQRSSYLQRGRCIAPQ